MADDKIKDPDVEKEGSAVESVTEVVPHPADADSAPGPYEGLSPDRPPVSTTKPDVPIAHSLVAGAGAPHDEGQVTPAEESAEAAAEASKSAKKD